VLAKVSGLARKKAFTATGILSLPRYSVWRKRRTKSARKKSWEMRAEVIFFMAGIQD
jgi:hypothetical protein